MIIVPSADINARVAVPTAKAAVVFQSRIRTELERAILEPICETCGKYDAGVCTAANCCGGRLRVAVLMNLNTTHCPLNHW